MRKMNYCQTFVICHGESEKVIAKYIRNDLRVPMIIYPQAKRSVQVTSIMSVLDGAELKTPKSFKRKFDKIEFKKDRPVDLKVFIILDLDDCTPEQAKAFKNKYMFKSHWLYEYIVPIFNSPDMDKIFEKIGYKVDVNDKVKSYELIFPVNRKGIPGVDLEEKLKRLSNIKDTNIDEFFKHCLDRMFKIEK